MEWYPEIKKEKDFEDQVVEFCARTAINGFNDFIMFFSHRDVKIRRLNKLIQSCVTAAGYDSAATVDAINQHINDMVNAEMANLAAAIEVAMDTSALDSSATTNQTFGNETTTNMEENQS